jgi:tRNA threonylcarbamoyladenosine biosynthesis protein TsaB
MPEIALSKPVLAFDSSTESMSIALDLGPSGAAGEGRRILERCEAAGPRTSQRLLPLVQELVAEAGIALRDIGLIGFGAGPGAFTGLRAACAAAQGLAWGLGVGVVPVNTLLAVAASVDGPGITLVANDARMGELYWAVAAPLGAGDWALQGASHVEAPAQAAAAWVAGFGAQPAQLTLCGSAWAEHAAALAAALPQGWSAALQAARPAAPAARAVARLARAAQARGAAVEAARAQPLYVRDKVALTTTERAAAAARAR